MVAGGYPLKPRVTATLAPGLWSGAVGHHFAHPGNRFCKRAWRDQPGTEGGRSAAQIDRDRLRAGDRDLEVKAAR